ncbi:MAG: Ger(x)C family spore germination protein [bacterium]
MKKFLCFFLALALLSASGCRDDRKPVDQLSLVSFLSFGPAREPGNKYRVHIIRPLFEPTREKDAFITHSEGTGLFDALETIQRREIKLLVFGKVRTVSINEQLAVDGINPILRQLDNIADFSVRAYIIVNQGETEDIEAVNLAENRRTGFAVADTIQTARDKQLVPLRNFTDTMKLLASPYQELTLPLGAFDLAENEFGVGGTAVFRRDRMVGKLTQHETMIYSLLAETVNILSIVIPPAEIGNSDFIQLAFTVRHLRRDVRVHLEGNRPVLTVRLRPTVDLKDYVEKELEEPDRYWKNTVDSEQLARFDAIITKYLKKKTNELIAKAQQEFRSDIFGFGKAVKVQQNRYFNSVEWLDEFPDAKITVDVDVTIRQFEGFGP